MSQSASTKEPTEGMTTPSRQVARRAFAAELNDATYAFRESEAERAPVFALLPTGGSANRYFHVGTIVEAEDIGSDREYWRGRVVDPTGAVFVYAGQYQPEAANVLRSVEPPAFVSVVGKPRTYETDDGDVLVSIRPESVTVVDAATRNRWVLETAQRTLERLEAFGDDDAYAEMARERYGDDVESYREAALEALESLESDDGEQADPSG